MMKENEKLTHYVSCMCEEPDHMLKLMYMHATKTFDSEVIIDYQLAQRNSFWKRLKIAFRYLFKRDTEYAWTETILDHDNVQQLRDFLDKCDKEWELARN